MNGSDDDLRLSWADCVQVVLTEPRQVQERVAALHSVGESIDETHHKLYLQVVDSDDDEEEECGCMFNLATPPRKAV